MSVFLITGGAGFIGSHIATRLVRDGHKVRIYDNLSTGHRSNLSHIRDDIEFFEADLNDRDMLNLAVDGAEVVYHQAALASVPRSVARPLDTHHACVTGTIQLLDACRQLGVRRLIYAASSSAYGNQATLPKHEGQRPQVLSPYAAAKLAGEMYCQSFASAYDLETVRIRYFNVFGPRQDPNSPYSAVIPLFVKALLDGKRPVIFGDGEQSRDFTFVENVVSANIKAASAAGISGNVYNAACGGSIKLLDLLEKICSLLGKPFDPEFASPRIGDVKHSWADISAAQRDLGYSVVVPLDEGLRQTVDYYVELFEKSERSRSADSVDPRPIARDGDIAESHGLRDRQGKAG